MSDPRAHLGKIMLAMALEATERGQAFVMPLQALIVRVKRGVKRRDKDGAVSHAPGRVLISLPDPAILNLKGPEASKDMWLIVRITRDAADVMLKEKPDIVRPTLVGLDGRAL